MPSLEDIDLEERWNTQLRGVNQSADQLNSYLSMSSIPEAAKAAQQRARQQELQRARMADAQELGATLRFKRDENALDRSNALARIEAAKNAGAWGNLTAAQRGQVGQLDQSIALGDELATDLETLPDDELGGLVGAGEWVLDTIGIDPLTEGYRRNFISGDVQEWRGRAAAISSMAAQAYQKGVLSDQDFKRIKAMDLSNTNLDKDQLRNRIGATVQIMRTSRDTLTGSPQDPSAPAAPNRSGGLSDKARSYLR